jgi:hypothetical protein
VGQYHLGECFLEVLKHIYQQAGTRDNVYLSVIVSGRSFVELACEVEDKIEHIGS